MASGQPEWGKILNSAVKRNNELRSKLGMEPRDEVEVDIPDIARKVIEENGRLHKQLLSKAGKPVEAKAPAKEPEQAEQTCDVCGKVVFAKTEGAAKALLTKHMKEHEEPQADESQDEQPSEGEETNEE